MSILEPEVIVPGSSTATAEGLKKGSIGLGGALMQSIAQISPTLGVFYTIQFTTTEAGISAPLTYLAAFLVCLVVAVPMVGLARHLPSAGGFYTYVSAGIGPKAGFMTGWLYAISVTVVPAALAAFTGAVIQDELNSKFGFNLQWWVYAIVILGICFFCAYRGLVLSVRFLLVMTCFEMVVGLGLALSGVIDPGKGGVNLNGFNPIHLSNGSGFFLAVVLSIFAFTGFESAATVAQESRNPRRIVPRAIFGSLIIVGIFYIGTSWGLQLGWGTDHLSTLASSANAPAFVLADRLFNGGIHHRADRADQLGTGRLHRLHDECHTNDLRNRPHGRAAVVLRPGAAQTPHPHHGGHRAVGHRPGRVPRRRNPDRPAQPVQRAGHNRNLRLRAHLHPHEHRGVPLLPQEAPG